MREQHCLGFRELEARPPKPAGPGRGSVKPSSQHLRRRHPVVVPKHELAPRSHATPVRGPSHIQNNPADECFRLPLAGGAHF